MAHGIGLRNGRPARRNLTSLSRHGRHGLSPADGYAFSHKKATNYDSNECISRLFASAVSLQLCKEHRKIKPPTYTLQNHESHTTRRRSAAHEPDIELDSSSSLLSRLPPTLTGSLSCLAHRPKQGAGMIPADRPTEIFRVEGSPADFAFLCTSCTIAPWCSIPTIPPFGCASST